MTDITTTPAGWYDDGSGRQRWWDGGAWTEHVAPPIDGEGLTPAARAASLPVVIDISSELASFPEAAVPAATSTSAQPARRPGMTTAERFWYLLQCIAFGAGYFAKVPAKKALDDAGLARMTSAEHFWYVLQCIAFGAGYFAKLPTKKALSEMLELTYANAPR